jgi:hypothetical protein
MRKKTMHLIFWGVLAVVSSSLLVMAGVWVGDKTGGAGGRDVEPMAKKKPDPDFENPLMGIFATELKDADDLKNEQRDEAMEILRQADPVWSRIKKENREGLRRANQHPRIVRPEKAAPAPEEKDAKPEPSTKQPEKSKVDSPGDDSRPTKSSPQ